MATWPYDIRDHYWTVGGHAGQVYSTNDVNFVPDTDARYVAWVADGHITSTVVNETALWDVFNNNTLSWWKADEQTLTTATSPYGLFHPFPSVLTWRSTVSAAPRFIDLQDVRMPYSIPVGQPFTVSNLASDKGQLTVRAFGGAILAILDYKDVATIVLTNNDTRVGTWDVKVDTHALGIPFSSMTKGFFLSSGFRFERSFVSLADVDGNIKSKSWNTPMDMSVSGLPGGANISAVACWGPSCPLTIIPDATFGFPGDVPSFPPAGATNFGWISRFKIQPGGGAVWDCHQRGDIITFGTLKSILSSGIASGGPTAAVGMVDFVPDQVKSVIYEARIVGTGTLGTDAGASGSVAYLSGNTYAFLSTQQSTFVSVIFEMPWVENQIYYGLSPGSGPGYMDIWILGYRIYGAM